MVHERMKATSRRARRGFWALSCVVASLALISLPVTANDNPLTPIRIAVHERSAMALLRWAEERGDFAAESLQATISLAKPDSLEAIADQTVDVVATGAHALLQASGADLRGFLLLAYSLQADALLARPNIDDIADLRGAHIGIIDGGSASWSELLLAYALQGRGLSESRVRLSRIDEFDPAALAQGDWEALAVAQTTLAEIEDSSDASAATPWVRLADASRSVGLLADMLVADAGWLRENKHIAKQLIRVWDRVLRAKRRDPEAAAEAIGRILDSSATQAQHTLDGMRLLDSADNIEQLRGNYQKTFTAMSEVLEKRSRGSQRRVASANRFLDLAPLRQVVRGR